MRRLGLMIGVTGLLGGVLWSLLPDEGPLPGEPGVRPAVDLSDLNEEPAPNRIVGSAGVVTKSEPDPERLLTRTVASTLDLERIPDDKNGYMLALKAAQALNLPDDLDFSEFMFNPTPEQLAFLRQLLADNAEALWLVKQAVALGQAQAPEITSLDQELPELLHMRTLGSLLRLQAIVDLADGRPASAIQQASLQEDFGRLLVGSQGVLVQSLVGLAVMNAGRRTKGEMAGLEQIAGNGFEQYARALRPRSDGDGMIAGAWQDSLRAERAMAMNALEEIGNEGIGDLAEMISPGQIPKFMLKTFQRPETLKAYYDVEATRALYDEYMSAAIMSMGAPTYGESTQELDLLQERIEAELQETKKELGKPGAHNPVGKYLVLQMLPSVKGIRNTLARSQADGLVQSIRIAVRLHVTLHGVRPPTLQELVPHFLPANPVDPWTGQAVSYSSTKGTIRFSSPDAEHSQDISID